MTRMTSVTRGCESEHRVAGCDASQLVIGGVGPDTIEEDADLSLPAAEIRAEDVGLVGVEELAAIQCVRRLPTSRSRWPSLARTFRTH